MTEEKKLDSEHCKKCGAQLCKLDRSLTYKLVNRGSTEFMCKKCLSEYFGISMEGLDELAAYYKSQGCMLF